MNFFGMGSLEILIILLVAFIFLGPERMIDAARTLGRTVRQLRRMSADLSESWLSEEELGLTEQPIVHSRGGRGHRDTDVTEVGPAETPEGGLDPEPDTPVGFKAATKPSEDEDTQQPKRETSG